MFTSLPERLRVVADIILESAPVQGTDEDRAQLRTLSERATASPRQELDHASQDEIVNRLPWARDYGMETFAEVIQLTRRLGDAVRVALEGGRRRGGPQPSYELIHTVAMLREIYEGCGGTFTHTPREKTHYDGAPHSAAGRFVLAFFEMCDPELRPHSISSAMAKVISGCPQLNSPGRSF